MFKSFFTFALTLISLTTLLAGTPTEFIKKTDKLLSTYVKNGRVDYTSLKASGDIDPLIKEIATVDLNSLNGATGKAYLINAYNLLVINQALENFPLKSVLDVNGFFDGNKLAIGGGKMTLNKFEKELILKKFADARLHFVLVCGANGCPPITNFAYAPGNLDAQLDKQTKLALNDSKFIRASGSKVQLSQIFNWYKDDFGGNKSNVISWINKYRNTAIATDASVSYYEYDWSLNKPSGRAAVENTTEGVESVSDDNLGNNALRYVVSSTIPKGTAEIKIFNNLYSQETAQERSSFFTSLTSAIYGVSDRINIGFDLRYRRVRYDAAGTASNFDVLRSGGSYSRSVVSTIGPKVRIAPFNKLPNFSIQSAFWIPTANELEGNDTGGRFVDWTGATWFTQVFNDFPIGDNFSIFTEIDFNLEDIGDVNQFSTPLTGIVSYFPTPKATLYGLGSYAPFWGETDNYFYQLGGGAKYQFTPNFELELLITAFDNEFLSRDEINGSASTVNLGVRFNL